jgi:GNAT superfamily N-acetyltransferase
MNAFRTIRKLRRNLRDYGVIVTCRKTVAVFRVIYERRNYRIYRIDLRRNFPSPAAAKRLTFRFLTPEDTGGIEQIEQMEEWLVGGVRHRLCQGSLCLAAFDGQQLVAFNLISFGRVHVPVVDWTRTFRSGCAWGEQISTVPAYRRQGVASELRYRIFAELKRRGVKRLYGGALVLNRPSLSLARKMGFEEIATVKFRKLLKSKSSPCRRFKAEH